MGFFSSKQPTPTVTAVYDYLVPEYTVEYSASPVVQPQASSAYAAPAVFGSYDGDKFPGGFGVTQLYEMDYWTLRQRSEQLFTENLYAAGIVQRLVTNEINTGLTPECTPVEEITGLSEDQANTWSETVETRFELWGDSPKVCDFKRSATFGKLQRQVRQEARVGGDVLIVMSQNVRTKLPQVQIIKGDKVQNPTVDSKGIRKNNTIKDGVEFDAQGREVAYWVSQENTPSRRVPAFGEKTGRRIAWLVFGLQRRVGKVRGEPLLSIVLQSLKEIDRYRDSTQRKAVVNSLMAMFIKKTEDKMGSIPIQGGAIRNDTVQVDTPLGPSRSFNSSSMMPGFVAEELQTGEEPVMLGGNGTDTNFGTFEDTIISAVAWAREIPPEILKLSFSSNYSASQAAILEFRIYLNKVWAEVGEDFCTPIYNEWLVSEALLGKIVAPGLLEAWRDPAKHDIFAAWVSVDWYGSIKPSTDMLKAVKASDLLVRGGYSTRAREARTLTGTKFSKNVKRGARENQQLTEMLQPLLDIEQTQTTETVTAEDSTE
jgi:lambda family phage portal protein